jgi:mannose/fructose/N-acetylgalactosamine-specific phosphotransferase system component IIC
MGRTVLAEMLRVAFLGGVLTLDRAAGWSFMLSQPIVGACFAGILLSPGPEWELWALRVPIGVGALLQLLLTDASLPAAQRQHETATAGVVGTAVALLGMSRLHEAATVALGGVLWVIIGVGAGLLAAVAGGWVTRFHRSRSRLDVVRADRLAAAGEARAFEFLYWGGLLRAFAVGALWAWGASLLGLAALLIILPRLGGFLTARRIAFIFAALLGAALAAAFHAHVRGRKHGIRWAALGATAAFVLTFVLKRGTP